MIDLGIFDKKYPVEDGIVNTLPDELNYKTESNKDAKTFFDVHNELIQTHQSSDLLENKQSMAKLQKEFYDKMADGFQAMDDSDKRTGGVFWWKIYRLIKYDEQFFKKKKLLFIGAGNCRLAIIFAKMGYDVTATDISKNMLAIGKKIADKDGIKLTYVAQNAELPFPFKHEIFDTVYSLCVVNHIVDWENYFTEKIRCIKPNGVLLERMPNAKLWSFWKTQGELNNGVEIKAKHCHLDSAKKILSKIDVNGNVWTHDRIVMIDMLPRFIPRRIRVRLAKPLYNSKAKREDEKFKPNTNFTNDDQKGIYTMIHVIKNSQQSNPL